MRLPNQTYPHKLTFVHNDAYPNPRCTLQHRKERKQKESERQSARCVGEDRITKQRRQQISQLDVNKCVKVKVESPFFPSTYRQLRTTRNSFLSRRHIQQCKEYFSLPFIFRVKNKIHLSGCVYFLDKYNKNQSSSLLLQSFFSPVSLIHFSSFLLFVFVSSELTLSLSHHNNRLLIPLLARYPQTFYLLILQTSGV